MTIGKIFKLMISAGLLVYGLSGAVSAAEQKQKSECAMQFDQCLQKCDDDYGDNVPQRAACVPVCSGKFAACDAGVAYEKAKPWIEDQAKTTKNFFDQLIEKYGNKDQTPDPQKKTKDNSI